jgi:hypothetical protein
MALNPAFTVSNNSISTNQFTIVDTSTGSDALIANRLIFLYDASNTLFTGAPIQFPLSAGPSISPAILDKDYAFNIVVQWVDGSGNMLYQTSLVFVFTGFLEWYYYGLVQEIAAQSNIMNDTVFFDNMGKLRTLIDSANNAISIAGSIFNAQSMILLAQNLVTNSNDFF